MYFLNYQEILMLHKKLINRHGGIHGIRDSSLAESAVFYPQMAHEIGEENDIHMLAAFYGYHLIKNHAFLDGNKRIGSMAMLYFLQLNNFEILLSNQQLISLGMQIATSQITEEEICIILKSKSRKIRGV